MTIMEQLLKTQELQKLQKDRANAKRLVTKSTSKLKTSLVLGTGEKYDFSLMQISEQPLVLRGVHYAPCSFPCMP